MLTVQHGRMRIARVPLLGQDDEFRGNELELSISRLVDERFRLGRVQHAIADERGIHVMNPHRSLFGTADAAAGKDVPGSHGCLSVSDGRRRVSHHSSQGPFGDLGLGIRGRALLGIRASALLLASSDLYRREDHQRGDRACAQPRTSNAHGTSSVRRFNRHGLK
jgi:hypothetical protein